MQAAAYCCCVKRLTIKASGSRPITTKTGKSPASAENRITNHIDVDIEYELRPDEVQSYCSLEWWESGGGKGNQDFEVLRGKDGKPDNSKPAYDPSKWNAAHERTKDGRGDAAAHKGRQMEVLENDIPGDHSGSFTPDPPSRKDGKDSDKFRAADDDPLGGAVTQDLDVLLVAKSSCSGCVSCCAWLRYSYSATAIDVEVLGAECSAKCDGIAKDYGDHEPFRDQLAKPGEKEGKLSSGDKGNAFSVPAK